MGNDLEEALRVIVGHEVRVALLAAHLSVHEVERLSTDIADRVINQVNGWRHARRSIKWDQRAISQWQNATFGEPRSNLGIAIRANEEMAELLRCLAKDDNDQAARMEVADVVIVLCRLVERLGGLMVRDVDEKMRINEGRTWVRRGDGHGQHVREPLVNSRLGALAKLSFAETSELLCAKCGGTGVTSVPFEPTTMQKCDCQK